MERQKNIEKLIAWAKNQGYVFCEEALDEYAKLIDRNLTLLTDWHNSFGQYIIREE